MTYKELKKIFHQSSADANRIYENRINDDTAKTITVLKGVDFFYLLVPDIYQRLLEIERVDRKVLNLANYLPKSAVDLFIKECMIDEIILTNDIEGVISTRKQIEAALDTLNRNDKNMRFQGIVNKYYSLINKSAITLSTCQDIRVLYDELVLDEVIRADKSKAPDGRLFRQDTVQILDAAQRIVHQNTLGEDAIISALDGSLRLLHDSDIEPIIRIALFHFVFSYIHPFYDGNGRTNRFIASYMLAQTSSFYAGIRLSFSIKENLRKYYKAFSSAEHPLNRGDLTPFVITFTDIVLDSLTKTYEALTEKNLKLQDCSRKIKTALPDLTKDDTKFVRYLIEGELFTSTGVTAEDMERDLNISKPTIHKRLARIKELGLLKRKRSGRRIYYSIDLLNYI